MRHNLFNRCCHFAYSDAVMWLKCVQHTKNAIFTQKFAVSVTPGDLLHHIEDYVTVVQSVRAKLKNFRKTAQL